MLGLVKCLKDEDMHVRHFGALGLVNLTNLFDPGRIVLSGGLSAEPELYLPPITAAYERTLFAGGLRPRPTVGFAELGPLAGGIGAALLVDL